MLKADGVQAAADREVEFHPIRVFPNGTEAPISAWQRRADTIKALTAEVNLLRDEVDALKEAVRNRPF